MSDTVRVVVGEGRTGGRGLLRFVLQGDGYEVLGDASTSAELARLLAVHQPDAVVIDDGIGVTAVQMAREVSPHTKIVLVWPEAIVPVGGDARVDPDHLLGNLGQAVAKAVGRAPELPALVAPAWIAQVRKDPATLRAKIAEKGGLPDRPSVTELQRRGRRLHPHAGSGVAAAGLAGAAAAGAATGDGSDEDRDEAAVVILPLAAAAAAAGPGTVAAVGAKAIRDRAIGRLALGGTAAATVVVLAAVVGASRIHPTVIAVDRVFPTPTPVIQPPPPPTDGNGGGNPGGGNPGGHQQHQGPGEPTTNGGHPVPTEHGGGGPPGQGGQQEPPPEPPADPPQPPGAPEPPGPSEPPPPPPPPPSADDSLPGKSALHNPLGGPPGQTGQHPTENPDLPGQGPYSHGNDMPGQSGDHNPHGAPPGHDGGAQTASALKHVHKF